MNACLFLVGAILAVVAAEAPLSFGPYPAPAPVYGPPKIIETVAPYPPAIPAPVYGPPPKIILPPPKIVSTYGYEVYTPKRVEILTPYPAPTPIIKTGPYPAPTPIIKTGPYPAPTPIIKTGPYPAPTPIIKTGPYPAPAPVIIKSVAPVVSTYNYEVPHIIRAPAPVYGPPIKIEVPTPVYGPPAPVYGPPAPVYGPPAPVYGPPARIIVPAPKPIATSYGYPVYTPQPIIKTVGPYPAPAPIVKIPEVPVAPHTEYGAPVF